MAKPQAWQNRIVGEGVESPTQLLANPSNWRIHPKHQQDALTAVLDKVGWVQRVIVNKRTAHIVDGHLRVSLAISRNEPSVPVVYVDLSEDEERAVLATIDPLSAMAATDGAKLAELLESVQVDDAALGTLLGRIGATNGVINEIDPNAEWQGMPEFQPGTFDEAYHSITVHFRSEDEIAQFAKRTGFVLGEKTRFVWFSGAPAKETTVEYISE